MTGCGGRWCLLLVLLSSSSWWGVVGEDVILVCWGFGGGSGKWKKLFYLFIYLFFFVFVLFHRGLEIARGQQYKQTLFFFGFKQIHHIIFKNY